jgi:hypothetical protein
MRMIAISHSCSPLGILSCTKKSGGAHSTWQYILRLQLSAYNIPWGRLSKQSMQKMRKHFPPQNNLTSCLGQHSSQNPNTLTPDILNALRHRTPYARNRFPSQCTLRSCTEFCICGRPNRCCYLRRSLQGWSQIWGWEVKHAFRKRLGTCGRKFHVYTTPIILPQTKFLTEVPLVRRILFAMAGEDWFQETFSAHSGWVERMPVSPHPNCKKHLKKAPRLTQNTSAHSGNI